MSKWMRQFAQWVLIGTLLVSMGGHFALLQTIAWGNMLVSYSGKASLTEAVGKTFDGDHPCEMCKMVKKSKSEEEKKSMVKAEMKMEIALPAPVRVPLPSHTDLVFQTTGYSGSFGEVYLAVPMQPPRVA